MIFDQIRQLFPNYARYADCDVFDVLEYNHPLVLMAGSEMEYLYNALCLSCSRYMNHW